MNEQVDLKEIERKAWRSYFQDGIWDIYLGLLLLNVPLADWLVDQAGSPALRLAAYIGFMGGMVLFFYGAKRWITVPRLGRVKFGRERKARKRWLGLILAVCVLLTFLLVLLTRAANEDPGRFGDLRSQAYLMPLVLGLVVGIPMLLIAFFNDFGRGYYIAVLYVFAIVGNEVWGLEQPTIFLAAGAIITLPGLVLLARYLREHPVPVPEGADGE